jgi:hypothetical protein
MYRIVAKTYKGAKGQPAPGFIWVDANHSYKSVMKDLSSWYPILGSGGMLAGTSYSGDTKRAVDEFALLNRITVSSSGLIWFIMKN